MPTFSIHTLGCRANQADSERLRDILAEAGFKQVAFGQKADCHVVNTCTVTREADRKSRQWIRRALKPGGQVVATGCAVAGKGGLGDKLPGAALRLPPEHRERLLELLGASACPGTELVSGAVHPDRTRALLKCQDGCNQFCTFCIVPYVRGRSLSISADELVRQARELEARGCREAVLTGIHLSAWGDDLPGKPGLVHLLERLLRDTRTLRYRLSSVEPDCFPAGMADLMQARPDRLCPHLHLVLQHASDAVLRRMHRGYTLDHYRRLVDLFFQKVPGACLTTDLMVGFPGETDQDFHRLLHYVRHTPFYRVHVFPYSPRPGTAAARFHDQVPTEIRNRRRDKLLRLADRKRIEYLRSCYGSIRRVLVERAAEQPGWMRGLAENYVEVRFRGGPPLLGSVVPVKVLRRQGDTLVGSPVGEDFPAAS